MNTNENLLTSVQAPGASGPARGPVESKPLSKPIVYACSGCSDAGELTDSVARALARTGVAEMSCLAGIGGRVRSLVNKAERAESILVIDGCPLNCARNTLQLAGFQDFQHLELHRLGFRKGSCPPTPERVAAGTEAAARMIGNVAPCAVAK
jgi:uncharacterized metal-binding protein